MRIGVTALAVAVALLSSTSYAQTFWEQEGKIENTEPPKVSVVGPDGGLYPGVVRSNAPRASDAVRKQWDEAKAKPTPRIHGKPDFSGRWLEASFLIKGYPDDVTYGGIQPGGQGAQGSQALLFVSRGATILTMENDSYLWRRLGDVEMPLYKPEHWAKVRELDRDALKLDTQYHCKALGVPRMGRPHFALQHENHLVFLNTISNESQISQWRIIRIGQPHDQQRIDDYTPNGSSVATWDGDALVIETKGLGEDTWLGPDGLFHSTETRVVERITRTGDAVSYDVTVEDPEVLQRPWVRDTRYYLINNDPKLTVPEAQHCSDVNAEFVPNGVH
jgi:hypothetical protein